MTVLRSNISGEVVSVEGIDGYDPAEWLEVVGAVVPVDTEHSYELVGDVFKARAPMLSVFDYLRLFTDLELAAAMASVHPRMRVAVALTLASPTISLGNADVLAGIGLMTALGILTPARAAEIRAAAPPPPPAV